MMSASASTDVEATQGRAFQQVLDWVAATGFERAPRGLFVPAAAVVASARSIGPEFAVAAAPFLSAVVLGALRRACGSVERRKAPYAKKCGETQHHWGVTCPALPAVPFSRPKAPAELRTNKKERAEARRVACGEAPPDPGRARQLPDESGVRHFTRYTDELLSLRCAPQLLTLRLFPDAKELSESFACFHAARSRLSARFAASDPAVTMLAIGDGLTPRTAALFAFRTAWTCIAIDPLMREPDRWASEVERLCAVRATVQAAGEAGGGWEADRVLLVLPHAHVGLKTCLRHVRWRAALAAVVMPCCNWYGADSTDGVGPPAFEEEDGGVVSPHRLVRVWEWCRGQSLPPAVPEPLPVSR